MEERGEDDISFMHYLHHRLTPPLNLADSSIENAHVPLYWYTLSYVPFYGNPAFRKRMDVSSSATTCGKSQHCCPASKRNCVFGPRNRNFETHLDAPGTQTP
jgi:hypothetical protein